MEGHTPDRARREIYTKQRGVVKTLVRAARKLHFSARIENCSNTKQLFSVSNGLPGKSKTTPFPSDIPRSALPDRFCLFFSPKIQNIRQNLDAHSSESEAFSLEEFSTRVKSALHFQNPRKGSFNTTAETSIRKRSASKSDWQSGRIPETLHYRDCQLAESLNGVAARAGYNPTGKRNFRSVPCSEGFILLHRHSIYNFIL